MINIKPLELEKYKDTSRYLLMEGNIYKDLTVTDDDNYRLALTMDLEENEDSQYPLDDVLVKFYMYVSEWFDDISSRTLKKEFAGSLEELRLAAA